MPGGATLSVPAASAALAPGANITLGLRPETLELAAEGALRGIVDIVEHLGAETLVHLKVPEAGLIIFKAPADCPVRPGETASAAINPARANLFGADGQAVRTAAYA